MMHADYYPQGPLREAEWQGQAPLYGKFQDSSTQNELSCFRQSLRTTFLLQHPIPESSREFHVSEVSKRSRLRNRKPVTKTNIIFLLQQFSSLTRHQGQFFKFLSISVHSTATVKRKRFNANGKQTDSSVYSSSRTRMLYQSIYQIHTSIRIHSSRAYGKDVTGD